MKGMNGYGLSGPAEALYEHFGMTPEAVVQECLGALRQK
jgi:transketolase